MAKVRGQFAQLLAPGLAQLFSFFLRDNDIKDDIIDNLIIQTLVDTEEASLILQETMALKEVFNISYKEADKMRIDCNFYL